MGRFGAQFQPFAVSFAEAELVEAPLPTGSSLARVLKTYVKPPDFGNDAN
jgi:hypothetical protein